MTATEFNQLTPDMKGDLVFSHGEFLEDRVIYGKYTIVMYSLLNFYVEAFYNIETNAIEAVMALDKIEDWENYMQSIDLDKLF